MKNHGTGANAPRLNTLDKATRLALLSRLAKEGDSGKRAVRLIPKTRRRQESAEHLQQRFRTAADVLKSLLGN